MNKRMLLVLFIVMLLLTSCDGGVGTGTPSPTRTPTPIPANPAVIDWHLQFSSVSEIQLFRCSTLANIDSGTVTLMNPVNVRLSIVPITPQMLEESQRIFSQTNVEVSETIVDLLSTPTTIIFLTRLDFESERDVYEPYRMLRSSANASVLYSLSEIRFEFNNEEFTDAITLRIGDSTYMPTKYTEEELEVGMVYPVYFTLNNEDAQTIITSQQITLSIDIGMLVPFRLETCQSGNYQQFTMQPRIVSGAAHELPVLYGSPGNQISSEIVDEFRLTLLSDTLPGLAQTFTEFTLEAEATAEATGIVEITPEATSEVESSTQD